MIAKPIVRPEGWEKTTPGFIKNRHNFHLVFGEFPPICGNTNVINYIGLLCNF